MEYLGYSKKIYQEQVVYNPEEVPEELLLSVNTFRLMLDHILRNNTNLVLLGGQARFIYALLHHLVKEYSEYCLDLLHDKVLLTTFGGVSVIEEMLKMRSTQSFGSKFRCQVYGFEDIGESYCAILSTVIYPNIESILLSMGSSCNQVCYYKGNLYYTDLFVRSIKTGVSFETDGIRYPHSYRKVSLGQSFIRYPIPKKLGTDLTYNSFEVQHLKKLQHQIGFGGCSLPNIDGKVIINEWFRYCLLHDLKPVGEEHDEVKSPNNIAIKDALTLTNGFGLPFGLSWLEKVTGCFDMLELDLLINGLTKSIAQHIILYIRILKLKDMLRY